MFDDENLKWFLLQDNFTCFIYLAIHKPIIQKDNKKAFKSFNEAFFMLFITVKQKLK